MCIHFALSLSFLPDLSSSTSLDWKLYRHWQAKCSFLELQARDPRRLDARESKRRAKRCLFEYRILSRSRHAFHQLGFHLPRLDDWCFDCSVSDIFPFSITSFPSPSMLIPTSNRGFFFFPFSFSLHSLDSTPIHLNTILGQSLQFQQQVSTSPKVLL